MGLERKVIEAIKYDDVQEAKMSGKLGVKCIFGRYYITNDGGTTWSKVDKSKYQKVLADIKKLKASDKAIAKFNKKLSKI